MYVHYILIIYISANGACLLSFMLSFFRKPAYSAVYNGRIVRLIYIILQYAFEWSALVGKLLMEHQIKVELHIQHTIYTATYQCKNHYVQIQFVFMLYAIKSLGRTY